MENFIALDEELEQPNTNPQTPDSELTEEKIIQVGWVVFSTEPEFTVLKTTCDHVYHNINLSKYIKNLTRIQDSDIQNGLDLQTVYKRIVLDLYNYDCQRIIVTWGAGDIKHLMEELGYSVGDKDWEFGRSGCNVKHIFQMYADANGLNRHGGLSKCVAKLELTWCGHGKHNAMIDAYNTAQIYNFMYHKLKNK